jgi:hypothetical protein
MRGKDVRRAARAIVLELSQPEVIDLRRAPDTDAIRGMLVRAGDAELSLMRHLLPMLSRLAPEGQSAGALLEDLLGFGPEALPSPTRSALASARALDRLRAASFVAAATVAVIEGWDTDALLSDTRLRSVQTEARSFRHGAPGSAEFHGLRFGVWARASRGAVQHDLLSRLRERLGMPERARRCAVEILAGVEKEGAASAWTRTIDEAGAAESARALRVLRLALNHLDRIRAVRSL